MQRWKEFRPGYSISDHRNIRNDRTGKLRVPQKRNTISGHLSTHIVDRNYSYSRLVAEHFVPNPENLPIVRHWDGNEENNHYTNLVWGTQKDNTDDAFRHGTHTSLNSESFKAQQNVANSPAKVCRKRRNNLPMGVSERSGPKGTKYIAKMSNQKSGQVYLGSFNTIEEA